MTYRDVNEPLTPDDVVFVVSGRSVGNRLHVLEESDLGFRRKAVMMTRDGVRLWMMGVNKRVVMCNAAAVRRLYTRGNNEVLLWQFFLTPPYCANRHVQMTGDSHCFSKEEDDMTQAL
jgi:hypothetical protein